MAEGDRSGPEGPSWSPTVLITYLVVFGLGSTLIIITNLPVDAAPGEAKTAPFLVRSLGSPDRAMTALALCAGAAGSFIHSAQSLASYLGNQTFRAPWTTWYLLRPWIGSLLGFILYIVARSNLVAGMSISEPFALLAVALLGGWFSKTASDKLQQVFDTILNTREDEKRADKLRAGRPFIEAFEPRLLPADQNRFALIGGNFEKGAVVLIDGIETETEFVSARVLRVTVNTETRPSSGEHLVRVKNPSDSAALSDDSQISFE